MIAEILATGDEILTGAVIDSNSAYIAQKLEEAGIEVIRHGCVGDDVEALTSILQEISVRADLAVITGGLGPTLDDITAEAAARAAGIELVFDQKAMSYIEDFLRIQGKDVITSNKKQAMLPQGSDCLLNSVGTAPGFMLRIGKCAFFFLPGVPSEMRKMLSDELLPRINELQKEKEFTLVKTISTFGLAEAAVNERLASFPEKFPEIKLNTSYSYGIDDNDFTLAFETDDLSKFQDLIMQLRETKVSLYVVKDTPMIVCLQRDIQSIIMGLG